MAITYTYDSGQLSHFACKKIDGSCCQNPSKTVLVGVFCKTCKFFEGYCDNCVLCSHPDNVDDNGTGKVRSKVYERISHNALCCLDY